MPWAPLLIVLPSSSTVRIFCAQQQHTAGSAAGTPPPPGTKLASEKLRRGAYKVDTDGTDVGLCVCVVGEPQQEARLSHTRVSNQEELEQVVTAQRQQQGSTSATAQPPPPTVQRDAGASCGRPRGRPRGRGRTIPDSCCDAYGRNVRGLRHGGNATTAGGGGRVLA
eukprot:scaffold4075_cov299-Prasinococcus_capsulatus_cf.AAC.6